MAAWVMMDAEWSKQVSDMGSGEGEVGIREMGWAPARRRLPTAENAFRRKATDQETLLMRVQGDGPFLLPRCRGRTDGAKA